MGKPQNRPSGRQTVGRRPASEAFQNRIWPKSGPEVRFPARNHYCVTQGTVNRMRATRGKHRASKVPPYKRPLQPCEFIEFGAMDATKPYKSSYGLALSMHGPKTYKIHRVSICVYFADTGMADGCCNTSCCCGKSARGADPQTTTLCYAVMLPGRKSRFRAGFRQDSNKGSFKIGPPAGRKLAGVPILSSYPA